MEYPDYKKDQLPSNLEQRKIRGYLTAFLTLILFSFIIVIFMTHLKSQSTPINHVQTGIIDLYDSKAIGPAFNAYFTDPKWENFETDHDDLIVEFTGRFLSGNQDANCLIQFTVYPKQQTFEITYYELDGVSQPYESLLDLLDSIYSQ